MDFRDSWGNSVTGADPESLHWYERALHELQCYIDDPVATIDRAIGRREEFVLAHIFKAYLNLLGTEPLAIPTARDCYETARGLAANDRERGHVEAIGHLVAGRWHAAGAALEDIAIEYPRDALALQAGHVVDFYVGDSRMLRDRIARALPAWAKALPGYHALLGMHAFGLEETGDYARAEKEGRRGVELEPRDGWSQHAVAHVMEMQGRQQDGIAWMRADPDAWSQDSFFAVHNWWHLALYHLDLGEIDEVLRLFDGPIYGKRSTVVLDMIDASAMLWRLHLRDIDVGDRWSPVADNWAVIAEAGTYAFNDVHAVMAFIGAGRDAAVERVLAVQSEVLRNDTMDNAQFVREVGHPVTRALQAFGEGDYRTTIRLLRSVRNIAHRFGGSHAQRDLLDLTLIEAAFRAGDQALARALACERVAVKPTSPLARLFGQRAATLPRVA